MDELVETRLQSRVALQERLHSIGVADDDDDETVPVVFDPIGTGSLEDPGLAQRRVFGRPAFAVGRPALAGEAAVEQHHAYTLRLFHLAFLSRRLKIRKCWIIRAVTDTATDAPVLIRATITV